VALAVVHHTVMQAVQEHLVKVLLAVETILVETGVVAVVGLVALDRQTLMEVCQSIAK
jgi:hypothetical protein